MAVVTLGELIQQWLPGQRWFAGKDAAPGGVRIVSDRLLLDGDPALRHVICDVTSDDASMRYQLLIGVSARLPAHLEHAAIGRLDDDHVAYAATHDHDLMHQVLGWVASDAVREGIAFSREPTATIDVDAPSLLLGTDQSNTSVVFGEATIMKVFRILVPGLNPDLEITRALTRAGNPHIAAAQGWIETDIDGVPYTLAILQEFLRNASDGWALALTSVRDLFAEGDLHAEEVGGDFAGESERLGMATAEVHTAMAEHLGTKIADPAALASLAASMRHRLAAATSAVPDLAEHAAAIESVFAALAERTEPLVLQRIHGDLHLGQVMRTDTGWALLDFEGEPGAPIDERAAPSSPLRDVAGMLRSFDYASRYLLADHPGAAQLEYRAVEWAQRNRDAFCDGYAKVASADPRDEDAVLRAFELDKAVYEVVYETRNRPAWAHIPLDAIGRLVA